MARITLDLKQFKASGIYFLEFDAAESIVLDTQTIRLVVGFSRKGPFNAPVYIEDPKTAKRIFGGIDPMLERRGSYFHRSILTCLEVGPVFALNLLPLNNGQDATNPIDEVSYVSLSLNTGEANGDSTPALYSSFYNKEGFWFPDTEYFLATVENAAANRGKLINLVNIGQTPMSVLIKKASVSGFDITTKEWYTRLGQVVPEYVGEDDYVSEYFVEVIMVEGEWSDNSKLSIDPIYSKYFDANGMRKDMLVKFLSAPETKILGSFVGCIIPDFVDGNGINHFIETMINNSTSSTGLFCAVNREALDDYENSTSKVDMVGHNLIETIQTDINFLSYKLPIQEEFSYDEISTYTHDLELNVATTTNLEVTISDVNKAGTKFGKFDNKVVISKEAIAPSDTVSLNAFSSILNGLVAGKSLVESSVDGVYMLVETVSVNPTKDAITITLSHPSKTTEAGSAIIELPTLDGATPGTLNFVYKPNLFTVTSGVFKMEEFSPLFIAFENGIITNGDKIVISATDYYIAFSQKRVDALHGAIEYRTMTVYTNPEMTTVHGAAAFTTGSITINSLTGNLSERISYAGYDITKTKISLSSANKDKISVGDYIVCEDDKNGVVTERLTRVIQKRKVVNATTGVVTFEIILEKPAKIYTGDSTIARYQGIDTFATRYNLFSLPGFRLTSYHLPGDKTNKASQLAKILGMLQDENSNISKSLKSRDIIQFRYIVDTFDGGLAANSFPKNILSNLAKNRQKCLAILNPPSMKEFSESTDPRFTEEPTASDPKPIISARYISQGGNLSLGPSFQYSLPDEENGAKFCGFFAPYVKVRENNKNITIPPAAIVSNNFVRKFINGNPYSIVAGSKRGMLSSNTNTIVGVEYNFSDDDRANIEPFGWNPIIQKKGTGPQIFGNQMAYQRTQTPFNNLHVRDLLITIEEGIEDILSNYIFDFNNTETRLQIKDIVESFLENIRVSGGIYDFTVIMNDKNNPSEVIQQRTGILDVAIEPAEGMHKFITRLTILKPGGISSGGFTVA